MNKIEINKQEQNIVIKKDKNCDNCINLYDCPFWVYLINPKDEKPYYQSFEYFLEKYLCIKKSEFASLCKCFLKKEEE